MAVAKYTEIYTVLRSRIEQGQYGFRDLLPSENALAQEFSVSRNTLRKALDRLSDQGYIQSMQGRGIQVIYRPYPAPRFFLSNIESMAEACQRIGVSSHTVLLSSQHCVISESLAAESGLPVGAQALALVRLRLLNDRPVIVDRSWFLTSVVPSVPDEAARTSVYEYLEDVLGVRTCFSTRTLTVEEPDDLDRQHLEETRAVCVVTSLGFDSSGTPFEFTRSHHVSDTFGFVAVARRSPQV